MAHFRGPRNRGVNMPSDDDSKAKGGGDNQGVAFKAIAAVFATVVAPVLVAIGMKFSDNLFAPAQPKPAEPAKAEPDKSSPSVTQATAPLEAGKTQVASANSAVSSTSASAVEHRGKRDRKSATATGSTTASNPAVQPNTPTAPGPPNSEFKPLFNGRDLTGWGATRNVVGRWTADAGNGVLSGNHIGDDKKVRVWLLTDQEFADFRLRCEFRMAAGTESGLALRCEADPKNPDQVHVKLCNDPSVARSTGTVLVMHGGGAGYLLAKPTPDVTLRPTDEWNIVETEVQGTHLRLTINGQVVHQEVLLGAKSGQPTVTADMFHPSGRIGLICLSGHIEFRKIEIQELDSTKGK